MPPRLSDGDLGRPAADVDDEAAGRLADRQPGADRGGHRLLDEARPAGPGVEGRVADGALLDLGHARRDAEQHPRPRDEPDPVVDPVHEVLDHLLGDVEVADDAVAQRADRDDVGRRPADHPLGLGADGQDALGLGVDGDDGRLAHDDAAVADMDEGVGGPEVDADVAGEEAEQAVEHGGGKVLVGRVRGSSTRAIRRRRDDRRGAWSERPGGRCVASPGSMTAGGPPDSGSPAAVGPAAGRRRRRGRAATRRRRGR